MQKAYLVISQSEKKIVDADDVEHSDYRRIFQCPNCSETLTLRGGYFRNGSRIPATFVHPDGDPSDCPYRVPFNISSQPASKIFDLIKKGQNSKKLEQAFLKCLSFHMACGFVSIVSPYSSRYAYSGARTDLHLKRRIEWNEKAGKVYSDPSLFIHACSTIFKSKQSQQYLEGEIEKFEKLLKTNQKALHYLSQLDRDNGGNRSEDYLIRDYCKQLKLVVRYMNLGASDSFREEILRKTIWGDKALPVFYRYIWTNQEIKNSEEIMRGLPQKKSDTQVIQEIELARKPHLEFIQSFNIDNLRRISEEPQFLRGLYLDFYNGVDSSESKFIQFVLSKVLESVKFCDWSVLPSFYA